MKPHAAIRRLALCASGAAAIEFALIGLLVVSLVLGVFEFGRALFTRNQLAYAADIATRHVLINPPKTNDDLDRLGVMIRNLLPNGQDVTIKLNLPGEDRVMPITLQQNLKLFLPTLHSGEIAIRIDRKMPLESF